MRAAMLVEATLCACLSTAAAAAPSKASDREALREAISSLIDHSPLSDSRLSAQVRSLDDGSVVFARDPQELLNPASNVKLFTAAAALSRLGSDYRFETEFLVQPDCKDGRAKVLFVRGRGDPSITSERLFGVVAELVHQGLSEVQDIIVDDSWFDAERLAPGYDQESGDKAYLAPTGALSLNWNAVGVHVRPSSGVGRKASVLVDPMSDYFVIDQAVTTGFRTQRRFAVSSHREGDRQKIRVAGVVPLDKGTWSIWKKIDEPALYFGGTLKAFLKAQGVKVNGRVRAGIVPAGQKMLYVAQSDSLDIILKRLNKQSQNFVAEQLIKTLGAEGRGAPGTTAKGIEVVEDFLAQDVGIPRGSYVMKNGSGLNDANRFSALQTNELLLFMAKNFPLMPEYLSALGIAGKDGTIKYRFEGSDAVGRLRAKTGTLENVSALSGYVQAVGGERFVFSVLVNDFTGRTSGVVKYIDAVGVAVAASGSPAGPAAAVLSATQRRNLVGSLEDLAARLKTFSGVAQTQERNSIPFLRTAWRSEPDPAVRAVIAEALYRLEPQDAAAAQRLLDSAQATDDVYGRLRLASKAIGADTPLLLSLVELAASGNAEACARLLEFIHASMGDETMFATWSEHLAVVAADAPEELLAAFKAAPEADRGQAIDVLVEGLVQAARADAPLWSVLRSAQSSSDESMVEFARQFEEQLLRKIDQARAPAVSMDAVESRPPWDFKNASPPESPGGG